MYDRAAFLASLKHEAKILKHLAAQLRPEHLDYRPTPAQRSTLELLRYLAIGALGTTDYTLTGSWDRWEAIEARAKDLDLAAFPKAIDRQIAAIARAIKPIPDAQLKRKRVKSFTGQTMSLGAGLVEMVLKPLTAYRMQLFLYAKAAGLTHLATPDCWAGRAPKAPKAKTAAG